MKHTGLLVIIIYTVVVTITTQYGEGTQLVDDDIIKRQSIAQPTKPCNSSNEGESLYKALYADMIWICKSKQWTPYKLSPSIGTTKSLSATSCNTIKQQLTTDCNTPVTSGIYWVQDMQVYCDMEELDGGGWTLVWQHSYMEHLPLTHNMTFFSDHYKNCTTRASGWCNIPNKARFSEATEQMIVAYHKGTVVHAYKGLLNRNIDYNWSGAILLDFVKIVDKCTSRNGVQPAPQNARVIGLSFDKATPYNYKSHCDTYWGTLTSPGDCRWENCRLPSSISSITYDVQMTVSIFVR
ncbi:uncharacterized protein [Dysidea avara]|uniref:uncharacterized protein n=1 Tax=Dysidea avara TaxID=196820 RepID=UPI00332A587E